MRWSRNCFAYVFIYLKGRVSEIKGNIETESDFLSAIHSTNGCKILIWAGLKLGARNSVWISHMDSRDPRIQFPSHCFLRNVNRQLCQRWKSWDLNWHPYGRATLQAAMPQCWPCLCILLRKPLYSNSEAVINVLGTILCDGLEEEIISK